MKSRNHYTAEQKVGIVRRHLLEKIPVSDICDQYKLKPTVYYRWQKQLFENGAAAFEHSRDTEQQKLERQVASLKSKIEQKNEVVAELMQEHVALKKSIGEI